jgi:hypothetical protein
MKTIEGESNLGNVFTGLAYLLSIVLASVALGLCVVNEATPIMSAISIIAFLLHLLLVGGIYFALTDKRFNLMGTEAASTNSVGARGLGIGVGGIVMLFIIVGAVAFPDISSADLPSGGVLAISALLALTGGLSYRPPETPPLGADLSPTPSVAPQIIHKPEESGIREKEIIREKEVIIKVRCAYCQNTYDETLDKCPHCGAKR